MGSSGSFDSISDPYIKRVKFEGGGGVKNASQTALWGTFETFKPAGSKLH